MYKCEVDCVPQTTVVIVMNDKYIMIRVGVGQGKVLEAWNQISDDEQGWHQNGQRIITGPTGTVMTFAIFS